MKMEFLLHEKDLWEIISRKLLPSKIEFEKITLKEVFINIACSCKKNKLVHGTMFSNVVDSLLHHVTCVKNAKQAWDNLCATFE